MIKKAQLLAAHLLEANEDDMEFAEGRFSVKGSPTEGLSIVELAYTASWEVHRLPDGMEPNLSAETSWDPPNFTFPFGTHVAVVEVDEETGGVEILQVAAVDDCGNQLNPVLVHGQVHGGLVQAIGQALFEEAVYDDYDGNPLSPSFLDYLVPSAAEVPSFDLDSTVTPSPSNPLGTKGVGEAGAIGGAPRGDQRDLRRARSPRRHQRAHAGLPDAGVADDPGCKGERPMISANFDYVVADSVQAAIAALTEHGDEAKLIAGGHSLIPLMKLRFAAPSVLVDIGRLSDLSYIRDEGSEIAIGALTRYRALEIDSVLREHAPIVAHVAGTIGDPQVRHRGTIGGSLAHGDAAADMPAVVLALGGTLVVTGPNSERTIAATSFFQGFLETALEPDELITEIRVPKVTGAGWSYQKFSRRALDWAIVGVAAVRNGTTSLALVNMAPTPIRASAVESALAGGASIADAAALAAEGTEPPSDLNGDPEYRRHLVQVLVRRALEEADAGRSGSG